MAVGIEFHQRHRPAMEDEDIAFGIERHARRAAEVPAGRQLEGFGNRDVGKRWRCHCRSGAFCIRAGKRALGSGIPPVDLGDYQHFEGVVRSEGLEPPRFYSLPPQGSASTNSATSAWKIGAKSRRTRSGPGQRRRCNKSGMEGQGLPAGGFGLSGARLPGLHLLDFDRDPVAVDQHHAAGDGRLLARILTSSASVASSSMMAPRLSRMT